MRMTRARLVLGTSAVLGLIGVGGLGVPAVSAVVDGSDGYRSVRTLAGQTHRLCGDLALRDAAGTVSCVHPDVAPPGVDVDKPVATSVLEARQGGRERAVEAAQDEGVAVPAAVAAAGDRVRCDGDGVSGYRTQAMYVTTADRPNRFAALEDEIKQWAAGVDTVFNLSAAKTGGVRNVRYVTDTAADGTCTAKVLSITLPAGSFASFDATITAMTNAGFTNPTRKYLMWVDGTGQCGIAQTYPYSDPDQGNPNNGAYVQFARIDTACWGSSQSVEAHELAHTFGSVMSDAPHGTTRGHCYDESDRMCYADGGGKAMQQICPADQESLLDCNDDDYYSTVPPAGSYLATHWNVANSRFLIGGGDGGGTLGVPTRLGGTVSVNNPAVPGVATQVQASLEVPAGRSTTTRWSSTRRDCVFLDPAAQQTTVTCDAGATVAAPITLTVADSTGEKITRTTSLTFDRAPRPAVVTSALDGGSDGTYVACPTGRGSLSAVVRDQGSDAPVKGLTVAWYRTTGALAPVRVASAVTDASGRAVSAAVALPAGSYRATTTTLGAFATVSSSAATVTVTPSACPTALTADVSDAEVMATDPVTVSGALTRTLPDGRVLPAVGETVSVDVRAAGGTTWTHLATAPTGAGGSYSVVVRPRTGGTLRASLAARPAYLASVSDALALTVSTWRTALSVTASPGEAMATSPVVVTGVLTQSDIADAESVLGARPVSVTYPVAGGRTATASATTKADGTYTVTVRPTGSGAVTARYAGTVGWAPATGTTPLTVTAWQTAVTARTSATSFAALTPVTVSGAVTRTGAGATSPYASAAVTVTYPTTAGRVATVTVRTSTTGTYTVAVRPGSSGQVLVRVPATAGFEESAATPVGVTVG